MHAPRDATAALSALVADKLAAFDHIEPEFAASFRYIQEVHGERRFASFPVAELVHYLHALWICECKDRLLSVPDAVERYQGARGLALLRRWQELGETAELVAFLCEKLDSLDVAQLSRQLEAARHADGGEHILAQRLMRGRMLVLNRGMNLLHALDALFALPAEAVRDEALAASAHYGHTPAQIEEQLRQLETPQYAYMRHPALAQRNMLVMNGLGIGEIAAVEHTDEPASHVWRTARPTEPQGPYAEQTIEGYVSLRAPWHNNPRDVRWVDRPAPVDAATTKQYDGDPPPA